MILSISIPLSTMTAAFEPSSRLTFFNPALLRIPIPTAGLPVNEMLFTRESVTNLSPITEPLPVTKLNAPAGKSVSANNSARNSEDSGVWLAGFRTSVFPAAMAGPTLWATRFIGKLNGVIAPTTPRGSRTVYPILPSPSAVASMVNVSP
ncbi:Uncharacterised protein [Acinetobacter baumannii]|nr:Uncharacterised protein [Acinetobacter baumannii]